jgi:hypothetical protein
VKAWSKGTAACALLAIAAFAVGCGGGGDSSASGSADSGSLSKEDYVKKAKAACARAGEEGVNKGALYVEKHRSNGISEEALNRRGIKVTVLAAIEGRINALRALGASKGDEQELEAILKTLEADYDTAKAQPPTLSLTPFGERLESSERLQTYGLKECGF